MTTVPIQVIREAIQDGCKVGIVREARPGESPDFVQVRDKVSVGILGWKDDGRAYSLTFAEPITLRAGVGYVVELG